MRWFEKEKSRPYSTFLRIRRRLQHQNSPEIVRLREHGFLLAPRVLLVDNEIDFLDNLSQRVELLGIPAMNVTSGLEALATLDSGEVDVVLLDVLMSGIDGIQTLRLIKERHPRIEVVMLTGHADLERSLRSGWPFRGICRWRT